MQWKWKACCGSRHSVSWVFSTSRADYGRCRLPTRPCLRASSQRHSPTFGNASARLTLLVRRTRLVRLALDACRTASGHQRPSLPCLRAAYSQRSMMWFLQMAQLSTTCANGKSVPCQVQIEQIRAPNARCLGGDAGRELAPVAHAPRGLNELTPGPQRDGVPLQGRHDGSAGRTVLGGAGRRTFLTSKRFWPSGAALVSSTSMSALRVSRARSKSD